ncbi:hypothetical protein [Streptomyces pinistramenti]|uniref:hypothetical protein n=1 Tax=Streptomyces pinistramenti TaxID=2884812 RepID=UPI001D068153|nr:hypothetical protein [Streptomyces pinistramenti]MCB5910385.1 hypothetical protein [Streptomyces pinistramenti]
MPVVALTSAHASGVTVAALAMALSGPRPSLLAEADPKGGSVRTGYGMGQWGGEVGLWHLAQADREGALAEAFEAHLRRLDEGGSRLWLPGLTDPLQAAALAQTWEPLGLLLQAMDQHAGYDVVVDAGRAVIEPGGVHPSLSPRPLLHRADLVVLVVRTTLTSVAQSLPVARALQGELEERGTGADALRLLLVQEGSVPAAEIHRRLQIPVVGTLPWEEKTARLLTHGATTRQKPGSMALLKRAREAARAVGVDASTRRLRMQLPAPAVSSPVVASVVQRLTAPRQEVRLGG